MKKPEPPPRVPERYSPPAIADYEQWQALNRLLRYANEKYLYWDKFKHRPMPAWLSADDAWHYLKFVRQAQMRATPIRDIHGHSFKYWLPDMAQRHLHVIDRQAAGSITAESDILNSANRERYLVSSLMNEAIASSQIEGAATTRRVAREMLRTSRKPQNRGERMILNNYLTISQIRHLASKPLTPEMLNELHISMTRETLENPEAAGRYRLAHEDIVVQDHDQILHVPPPASHLPNEVKRLCAFANRDENEFVHPVVKGILLHFWLGFLHPYVDGNGRTARAVFYWYMLSRGYWLFEFLSISEFILKGRAQYDRAFLYAETDDLDATYFVMFNLTTIVRSLNGLHEYLARKQKEAAEMTKVLGERSGLNHRQQAVLRRALSDENAEFTIASHQTSQNIAFATARSDLFDLVERGLLRREKVGRKYVFVIPDDLSDRIEALQH
ncbi:MAG: Fic family protein [Thermoleophilia bacterium]